MIFFFILKKKVKSITWALTSFIRNPIDMLYAQIIRPNKIKSGEAL